jgi:hypothetical protein
MPRLDVATAQAQWQALVDRDPDYLSRMVELVPQSKPLTSEDLALIVAAAGDNDAKVAEYTALLAKGEMPDYRPVSIPANFGMPLSAVYGKFGARVRETQLDFGLSYITALCMCAPLVTVKTPARSFRWLQRSNLYGCGLIHSGGGKGASINRVTELFFDEDLFDHIQEMTLASEVGIMDEFPYDTENGDPNQKPFKVCVLNDEMETLLEKCRIKNSALMSSLQTLYDKNRIKNRKGGKSGSSKSNVELSLFGCLPVSTREQYEEFFDVRVNRGLRRRLLLAFCPDRIDVDITYESEVVPLNPPLNTEVFFSRENIHLIQHWWKWHYLKTDPLEMEGAPEIITRVACVSAAMSGEKAVSLECLKAAMALMDWQIALRRYLTPDQSNTMESKNTVKLMQILEEAQIGKGLGEPMNWRALYRKYHLERCGGATTVLNILRSLDSHGQLEMHQEDGKWNRTITYHVYTRKVK